jgi:hypothetical protein
MANAFVVGIVCCNRWNQKTNGISSSTHLSTQFYTYILTVAFFAKAACGPLHFY